MDTSDEFERALAVVRAQSKHLRESGLSKLTFACGVVNAFATTFVIGRWPEHYWAYHGVKSIFLLAATYYRKFSDGTQFYLLDFCWVVNAAFAFFSAYMLLDALTPGTSLA